MVKHITKCPFGLFEECVLKDKVKDVEWMSEKWIKVCCGMCIKATYAKAKIQDYKVVNTL